MSLSVGNGFISGTINQEKIRDIRDNCSQPKMSIWEKIKDFFFSTHQGDALKCLHTIFNHQELKMTPLDIHTEFYHLQSLAAEGHQDKFCKVTDHNLGVSHYSIDGLYLFSLPNVLNSRTSLNNEDISYNYNDDNTSYEFNIFNKNNGSNPYYYNENFNTVNTGPYHDENLIDSQSKISFSNIAISSDERYIQNIERLIPDIKEHINNIGDEIIVKKIGLMNALDLRTIGNRLKRNMNDPYNKISALKKDINELMKIPKIKNLIPQHIMERPEFSILLEE